MSPSKKNSKQGAQRRSAPHGKKEKAERSGDARPEKSDRKKGNARQTNILRLLALLAVIGITLYIYSIRERVDDFAAFGYPGIFLIALMANATVLLPAPGLAVIYAMGGIFHPLGVGLAAGSGGALGELSGYLAGYSGQAVIERADMYEKVTPWVEKYGGWAILFLAAIPNPFFDLAGVAAGAAKMSMRKFLMYCLAGQWIKMTLFAYAGKYSIEWFAKFIR